jgi:hypothetical protein
MWNTKYLIGLCRSEPFFGILCLQLPIRERVRALYL